MNWMQIVQLLITFGTTVKNILDQSSTNSDVVALITKLASPISGFLQQIGAQLFPEVKKELQIAAAAMATFDPNVVKWIQGAMNSLMNLPEPLEVDGIYGAKTKAAVRQFQVNNKMDVIDGWAGRVTQALIDTLLTAASAK